MKKLGFLTALLAVALSSCIRSQFDETPGVEGGEVLLQIGLTVEEGVQIVQTRAGEIDDSIFPEVDSLYVEVYRFGKKLKYDKDGKLVEYGKEGWNRMYFGKYEQAKDTTLRLNAGQCRLLAFHGDSTGCGFNKPYIKADTTFNLDGGKDGVAYINAKAKVANAKISVEFDETVSGSFYDYFVRFARIDTSSVAGNASNKKFKQILRYSKDETRDAYMMPTDSLQIQFMAQYEYGDDSTWKYAVLDTVAVNPNDHLKIKLSVNPRYGNLDVNIQTDTDIIKKDQNVVIQEIWTPQPAPTIIASGFPNGDHPVVEGDVTGNNATISILSRGGLKNCFLKVESDYLTAAGINVPLDEELDLANPTSATQAKLALLAAAGFDWQADMLGTRRLTYITMTNLFAKINELNPSLTVARNLVKLTVRVVDEVEKETSLELTSTAYPITQTLSIPEGKVWAKKIVSPELKVERGASSLYMLQVSADGTTWTDLKTYSVAANSVLDFGTLDVLPSTTYYYRTIYNENPNLISNVVKVTTESVLQVGNTGFENWQTQGFSFSHWFGSETREWYLPYLSTDTDPWWAVNSRKTMPASTSPAELNFKVFPTAGYSIDRKSGDKSALIYTVSVDYYNTASTSLGDPVVGELWIGKADDNGDHSVDGHTFTSRPTSVKFWYKYAPVNSEKFAVNISLKDSSGNQIAYAEKQDGPAAAEWTQCQIPLVYSDLNAKAANIYICFKSAVSGSTMNNVTLELAGKQQTSHIGSALRIDDIELVY